ncbi:deoxyribodipyrimidine photo-lyase [Alishewanella sp. SMS8]|uniref:deoxyribodipyrimidine photo-lyase n=1 Tax=Alishewanella sp. SMS8 TaxID=2994676 RepID=UPI002740B95F|nr:deoxyribodipyrimidine photo-lyase [Alishewanella sp. SMS8]MDP5457819.1 deoxyribodipyrimidine photo-lyase [Alishewanella sp. SMS8]
MKTPSVHLVWFRHDLRCHDNEALHAAFNAAAADNGVVIAVFIATAKSWQQHHMAAIRQDLLRRRVKALESELADLNIPLVMVEGVDYASCAKTIAAFIPKGLVALYAHREYEVREQQRDEQVSALLQQHQIDCHWFDRLCIMPPGSVLTQQGDVYKVFTPFKRNWLAKYAEQGVHCFAKPKPQARTFTDLPTFTVMQEGDNSSSAWPVAEAEVLQQMRLFCQQKVQDYTLQRDLPAVDGTSQVSPYLAIGVLSAQQCVARLQLEAGASIWQEKSGAAVWLSELIWRDFYKQIMLAFPKLIKHKAFQAETDLIQWPNNAALFEAWCQGKTGYPIVDAAMRQLNQTGWMHNRLRMITASFLVKDLHIDWRWGEQYFMSKLIDGDFAANNGGWQWAASTGTDAAPYFRIFNPVTQSQRFDANGDFIRKFIPELAAKSAKDIHWPHKPITPKGYAAPVVAHDQVRKIILALFSAVKNQENQHA